MKHLLTGILLLITFQICFSQGSITSTYNIYFKNNSYEITNDSKEQIKKAIKTVLEDSKYDINVEIIGYTDSIGSINSNLILSEKRAKAVYDYFMSFKNSKEGFVRLYKDAIFPSICHKSTRSDTIKVNVPISYKGLGIHPALKDEQISFKNIEGFRRVEINVIKGYGPDSWGVVGPVDLPCLDTIYKVNNALMLISQGSVSTSENVINPPCKNDVGIISVDYIKTSSEELFKKLEITDDSVTITIAKYVITEYPKDTIYINCKELVMSIPPNALVIPLSKTQAKEGLQAKFNKSISIQPFSLQPKLSPAEVPDTIKHYIRIPISQNFINNKDNLPSDSLGNAVLTDGFYYTTDVYRDTISIVKRISQNDVKEVIFIFKGKREPVFSLRYPYYDDEIKLEFTHIKKNLWGTMKYECKTNIYGNSKHVYIHYLNSRDKPKKKKIKYFFKKNNIYLLKQRKL